MKKVIPAYILSFIICFMLFIYEPITMYANNINDFWFDLRIIIMPVIKIFIVSFIALSTLFTLVYLINKKTSKKNNFYNILLIITFIIFFASYIQGNYLIGNLPPLDGTKFEWNKYKIDNIVTIIIWIIIILTYIVTTRKYKIEKVINVSKYIALAIFVMISISLITTMCTTNMFVKKNIFGITTENLYTSSNDKNFIIFLVDAVDSRTFDNVLSESKFKNTFEDFTYYPDTLAGYPFTRDSIPLILTGEWNENKDDFIEYYNAAMDNSVLIKKLKEKEYNTNIYEEDYKWNKSEYIRNIKKIEGTGIKTIDLLKQEIKYDLFKYLPYKIKEYSKIQTMHFEKYNDQYESYRWNNLENYKNVKMNDIIKTNEKIFKFIHLEGAHVAFDLDENMNYTKNGTYEQKIGATLTIINTFINKLKENDVYDNSVIVILSDHGYNGDDKIEGRQNPILYIKGINEHHKMNTSDKPISFADLTNAYLDLLEGKKSTELFSNIKNNRTRRYLLYSYSRENHMVEYETKGKAWDTDAMYKTGREFNR